MLAGFNPEVQVMAQQASQFVMGPPMPDIAPVQVSPRVWVVPAADGFPTPANQGMMSNVTFVVTSAGVVILDSGSSLQIGQMVIRMIRRITPLPVVAVFNSHHHGDHWLGNHAFVQAFGENLPIYSLAGTRELIAGVAGNGQSQLLEALGGIAAASGRIVMNGVELPLKGHKANGQTRRAAGISHVPEDRQALGLIMDFAASSDS